MREGEEEGPARVICLTKRAGAEALHCYSRSFALAVASMLMLMCELLDARLVL